MESTSPEFEFDGRHFNIESSIFLPPITETELQAFLNINVRNSELMTEMDLVANLNADLESKVDDHGDEILWEAFSDEQTPVSALPQQHELKSCFISPTGPEEFSTGTKSSCSPKKKEEIKFSGVQKRFRDRQRKDRISKEVGEDIGHALTPVSGLPQRSILESNQTPMSGKTEEVLAGLNKSPNVIPPTIEELEQVRQMYKNEQEAIDAIARITSDLLSPGTELERTLKMNMETEGDAIASTAKITKNLETPKSLISEEACLSIAESDSLKQLDIVYDPSEKFYKGSLWGLFAISFQMNVAHQFAAHTREDLKQQFSKFGKVIRVNITKDQDGNRVITVWFTEEKPAKNAIENLRNVYHGLKLKNVANTLLKSSNKGRSVELNGSICFNNELEIPIDDISEEWKQFGDVEVINLATSKRSKKARPEVYICFKNAVEINAAMQHFIRKDEKYPDLDLATSPIGAKQQGGKSDLISKEVGEKIGQVIKLIEGSVDSGHDATELFKEQKQRETPIEQWLKDSGSRKGGNKFTKSGNSKKQLKCGEDTIPRAPPNTPSNSTDQILGLNDTKVEGNRTRNLDDKDPASISPVATSTPFHLNKETPSFNSQLKLETVKENEIFVDMKTSLLQADQKSEDNSCIPQTSLEVDVPTFLELEISNSLNEERSKIARRELIQITKMLEESQTVVDCHSVNQPINEEEVGQQLTPIPSPSVGHDSGFPHPFFAFPSPGAQSKKFKPLAAVSKGQVKPELPLSPTLKEGQFNDEFNAEKGDGQQNTHVSSPSSESGKVDSIESFDETGLLFLPKVASDSITRINLTLSPISGSRPHDEKDLELSPVVSPIHPLPELDSKTDYSGGCCFSFGSPLVSSPKSLTEVRLASPNISILKANLDNTSLSLISLNDEVPTSEALDKKAFHSDHDSNVEKSTTSETVGERAETTPLILADVFGHYGLVMCGFRSDTDAHIEEVRKDFEFFGDLVSLAWRANAFIVKFSDVESAKAAFVGLKEKYKHLRPFQPVDIGPDRLGRFTLTFLDKKGKKYVGTKEEFFKYGEKPPLIAKGEGKFLIRVCYSDKKGALDALHKNAANSDFPELQIAPECEVSPFSWEVDSQGTLGSQNSQNSSCLGATNETANEERTDDLKFGLNYETEPTLCNQNVFDSHCHIDLMFNTLKCKRNWSNFKSNKSDCYNQNWSGCITVMCDPSTWNKDLEILLEPDVWAIIGCHPKHAAKFTADKQEEMRQLIIANDKIIAVGEIGLDTGHKDKCKFEDQEKAFRKCLEMAVEMDKPICLHVKGKMQEAREIMREVGLKKNHKIHFHCWGSTDAWEVCQELLEEYPNMKVGLTPLVTFATAANVHDIATRLPLDRMLLETDTPYFYPRLAHKSYLRCSHPGLVIHAASQVALLKGISVEDILAANRENVEAIYGI